jgi:hypothetical protein
VRDNERSTASMIICDSVNIQKPGNAFTQYGLVPFNPELRRWNMNEVEAAAHFITIRICELNAQAYQFIT